MSISKLTIIRFTVVFIFEKDHWSAHSNHFLIAIIRSTLLKIVILKNSVLKILAGFVVIIVGLTTYILTGWDKDHEAPFPQIKASKDPAIIARGKYLVYGPAHCASCHTPSNKTDEIKRGEEVPLTGGWEITVIPGTFRAPNITPDNETGIGKISDRHIARALRYSVNSNGKVLTPFMPFQEISDEDLTAIISYLRLQKPVKNYVRQREFSFLGKAVLAFNIFKPKDPKTPPPKFIKKDTTVSYGSYIANSVANCFGCHTEWSLKTGKFIGPAFAGGFKFKPDKYSKGYSFISPNITRDNETGIMAYWNEKMFINRFKAGRLQKGSPMPWESYSKMDTVELKALYLFLNSIKPVNKRIEKIVFFPGEKLPK